MRPWLGRRAYAILNDFMRIIVADDNASCRRIVVRMLREIGHEVSSVEDGPGLRHGCASGEFDAAICDINLGLEDGIALCEELKANYPALPICLMTGSPANIDCAVSAGFELVLLKPFSMVQLREILQSWALASLR